MNYKHWTRYENPLFFAQIEHNEAFPGREMKPGGLTIFPTTDGVQVNGNYGTNPNEEEMREIAEVMRECVAEYDRLESIAWHQAQMDSHR